MHFVLLHCLPSTNYTVLTACTWEKISSHQPLMCLFLFLSSFFLSFMPPDQPIGARCEWYFIGSLRAFWPISSRYLVSRMWGHDRQSVCSLEGDPLRVFLSFTSIQHSVLTPCHLLSFASRCVTAHSTEGRHPIQTYLSSLSHWFTRFSRRSRTELDREHNEFHDDDDGRRWRYDSTGLCSDSAAAHFSCECKFKFVASHSLFATSCYFKTLKHPVMYCCKCNER